jgi:type III secretion protein J
VRRLLAFTLLLTAGCGVELEHGLDERQANQIVTVLEGAGIGADKRPDDGPGATGGGGYKIVVSRAESGRAFALLEKHDLPRRGSKGMAETFGGQHLLPSAVEDRARFAAALSTELERSLEGLPGVTAARVHLALPAEDPLLGETQKARATASVLLKTRPGALPITDADVRRLVAGAVQSLQPADVSVVIAPTHVEPDAAPLDRFGPLRVAPESRRTLATLATSGLVLLLLLAIAMVIAALRLNTLRKRLRDLERR